MNKIILYQNANNSLENKCFSILRLLTKENYSEGDIYNIFLKEKEELISKGKALLVSLNRICIKDFTDYICRMSTGLPKEETVKIYREFYRGKEINIDMAPFGLMTFERLPDATDKTMLEQCPHCQSPWNWKEIQSQTCNCCGYPITNEESDPY